MIHALMCGGDVAGGRVVVGAEVRARATAGERVDHRAQRRFPVEADDGLRRLHHELDLDGVGLELLLLFEGVEQLMERGGLAGVDDLGQGHIEGIRELALGRADERR